MMRWAVGGWSSSPSVVRTSVIAISFVAACAAVGRRAAGDNHSGGEQLWTPLRTAAQVRVAIVGAGIAGLAAAYRLDPHCDIVLYEAEPGPEGMRTQYSRTVMRSIRASLFATNVTIPHSWISCATSASPCGRRRCRSRCAASAATSSSRATASAGSSRSGAISCGRRSPACCSISGASSATRATLLDDPEADDLTIGEYLERGRLRPRADRPLPGADGRGDLVVVAGPHARDAGALLHPLLRQPRAARRARRAAVVHDRGRLAGLRRCAHRATARSRGARRAGAQRAPRRRTASRCARATRRPSASTA